MANFVVDDYMMTAGLHLTGCELLLFALIFSYTRNNQTLFASEGNLADRLGYSRKQVDRALLSLRQSGLIVRSETKHAGMQSYDYIINMEQVRHNVPAWWDKMSQQGETKCPSEVRHNDPEGWDKMSHNKTNYKDNDKREDNSTLTPFMYMVLNIKWKELCTQPKWQTKSKESLAIAVKKLKRVEPPIAYYMMDYAIERGHDIVYDDNKEITKKAHNNNHQFYVAETQYRAGLLRVMLAELQVVSPVAIPTEDDFIITDEGASIKCSKEFMEWIERNGKTTFPIIKKWTLGLNLHYITR